MKLKTLWSLLGLVLLPGAAIAVGCGNDETGPAEPQGLGGSAGEGGAEGTPDTPSDAGTAGELTNAPGGEGGMGGTSETGPVWFLDDFEDGNSDGWELTPGLDAAFSVVDVPGETNKALQYTAGSTTDNLVALIGDAAWQGAARAAGVDELSDYYVEARIKPQTNSTTGNKQIYLVARYQDADNYYLGGLNVQNSSASTRVETGYRKAGTIARPVQVAREIIQGTQGAEDGRWYRVRLELVGITLTVYLDGENVGNLTDASFAEGKIGLFTANKSFLIDDVVVGDPSVKPVSLTLSPARSTWDAEVGGDPFIVTVNALQPDGSADTFTVSSSDETVVSVSQSGAEVTLTPLGEGTATVTFVSGSDAELVRTITANVAPAYEDSAATYAGLGSLTEPAVGEGAAYVDTRLRLTFDEPPVLGDAGSIRIFRADDDTLVDTIFVRSSTDALGPKTGTNEGRFRFVQASPISIDGNVLTVSPRHRALEYGVEYYVGISADALTGTLDGEAFAGIGKAAGWTFTTRVEPPTAADVTVDDDGTTADFRTVQGALSYVMETQAVDTPASVTIANGSYEELLFLRGKNNLTITGESRDGVVIHYENYDGFNGGTGTSIGSVAGTPSGGRSLFLIENVDSLTLDTLTLENSHRRTGTGDQAETIYFNAGGRLIAKNVAFLSEQDTIQVKGFTWFYGCLIAGTMDFIWGASRVALFEDCEIRMLGDSRSTTPSGGYLVQARTALSDKGFVFLNSRITHGPGPTGTEVAVGDAAETYLARSAGNATYFDNVSYINCAMDTHVTPVGWAEPEATGQPAPNPTVATAASGWREYGTTDLDGNPLDLSERSASAYVLTVAEYEAGFASRDILFAAYNSGEGWSPEP